MTECSTKPTPMELHSTAKTVSTEDSPVVGSDEWKEMTKLPFRALTGSLMYAVNSRPEIRFAVGLMAKASTNPSRRHWQLGMRILRYLKGTIDFGLIFTSMNSKTKLETYFENGGVKIKADGLTLLTDSDWGGDPTFHSTRGFLIYLNGCLVSARSKLNRTISINVSEAELTASVFGVQESMWLQEMARELKWKDLPPIQAFTDNSQVLAWIEEPNAESSRSKHLSLGKHWLSEQNSLHGTSFRYLPTEYMIADIMTKGPGAITGGSKAWTGFASLVIG
jgi:hypothetical protein